MIWEFQTGLIHKSQDHTTHNLCDKWQVLACYEVLTSLSQIYLCRQLFGDFCGDVKFPMEMPFWMKNKKQSAY